LIGNPGDAAPDAPPLRVCNGPGFPSTTQKATLQHFSATVTDATGSPLADVTAQVCGTNLCLNGTTNARGRVTIDMAPDAGGLLAKAAFKYGGGIDYVKFALPLAKSGTIDVDLGNEVTVAFDPPANGVALTPGTTATSHDVSLELPPDMNPVAPDPFDFDTPDLQKFRAAVFPQGALPAAVDPSLGLSIVIGLAPNVTELCPAAKMSVANTAGWPGGSRVEFWLHGVDVTEKWAPYGGWALVSTGSVTADGTRVETDENGGLPQLGVVGIRLAR
jgi:hypothetical protein